MKIVDCDQNSPGWYAARLGIPTASAFDRIITPTGKVSTQADGYANQLIAEIMAGEPMETFEGTSWTARGKELEPEAVKFYELQKDVETVRVGFVTTDDGLVGCSPDRLVGEDGLLEMKIPKPQNHVKYLLDRTVDRDYYPQAQGQLYVTGRAWVDVMSYHPKLPPVIVRVERDKDFIFMLVKLLADFNKSLQQKRQKMIDLGYIEPGITMPEMQY